MKGSVYPRPYVMVDDPNSGRKKVRRPVKKNDINPATGEKWGVDSTWTYQFIVVQNGKRRTITKGGYCTKKLAEAALTDALADHGKGAHVEPSKMKFGRLPDDGVAAGHQEEQETEHVPHVRALR
jgi:hypothetical protein